MKRRQDPWNFLFIAGMWFQDLFNYDFRRTEMCIIPYATQQGEISFCAYNTGVGWRQIIENMHKNATVAEWYKNHGKHEIYAKGKNVNLQSFEHCLRIDADDAARVRHLEHDIPLTAAEEDRARRKKAFEEQAKVRAIYEELVLKKPQPTVVQIGTVQDIAKAIPANFANANKPVNIAPAAEARSRTSRRRLNPTRSQYNQKAPVTGSLFHFGKHRLWLSSFPKVGAGLASARRIHDYNVPTRRAQLTNAPNASPIAPDSPKYISRLSSNPRRRAPHARNIRAARSSGLFDPISAAFPASTRI